MDLKFWERVEPNCWYPNADPSTAWREGWGWLFRVRTLWGTTALQVLATLFAVWRGSPWYATVALLICFLSVDGAIWVVRKVRVRQVWIGKAAHQFSHCLREDTQEIIRHALTGDKALYRHRYRQFHCDAAERIAQYFGSYTGDQSIGACIRLATRSKDGKPQYVTVGRSKRLDPNRPQQSQPIPIDQGVAAILRQKDKLGVYIYRDIPKAVHDNIWLKTPNDSLPDIKTVMVVPINGYIQGKKSMVGILYVGSAGNPFKQLHIEPLMAFADLLGLVYPFITGLQRTGEDGNA